MSNWMLTKHSEIHIKSPAILNCQVAKLCAAPPHCQIRSHVGANDRVFLQACGIENSMTDMHATSCCCAHVRSNFENQSQLARCLKRSSWIHDPFRRCKALFFVASYEEVCRHLGIVFPVRLKFCGFQIPAKFVDENWWTVENQLSRHGDWSVSLTIVRPQFASRFRYNGYAPLLISNKNEPDPQWFYDFQCQVEYWYWMTNHLEIHTKSPTIADIIFWKIKQSVMSWFTCN